MTESIIVAIIGAIGSVIASASGQLETSKTGREGRQAQRLFRQDSIDGNRHSSHEE